MQLHIIRPALNDYGVYINGTGVWIFLTSPALTYNLICQRFTCLFSVGFGLTIVGKDVTLTLLRGTFTLSNVPRPIPDSQGLSSLWPWIVNTVRVCKGKCASFPTLSSLRLTGGNKALQDVSKDKIVLPVTR